MKHEHHGVKTGPSDSKKGHGVTSLAMKQHGRNIARAMNQKKHGGSARGR